MGRKILEIGKTEECSLNDKTQKVSISASLSLCTDVGMILKCTGLVIAVATMTCFRSPQLHSVTALSRCGCCTLGYLSLLSIYLWRVTLPLWRVAIRAIALSTAMASVGQVLLCHPPVCPDSTMHPEQNHVSQEIAPDMLEQISVR